MPIFVKRLWERVWKLWGLERPGIGKICGKRVRLWRAARILWEVRLWRFRWRCKPNFKHRLLSWLLRFAKDASRKETFPAPCTRQCRLSDWKPPSSKPVLYFYIFWWLPTFPNRLWPILWNRWWLNCLASDLCARFLFSSVKPFLPATRRSKSWLPNFRFFFPKECNPSFFQVEIPW